MLLELMIALPIILIVAGMLMSTIIASSQQRAVNRENAIASIACQEVLERMRNEPFGAVFAMYNTDPFDDPNGPGTAPGAAFDVEGLSPQQGAVDPVGRVDFPVTNTGGAIDENWELREDLVDQRHGTPRDLNGDNLVDALDHAADYVLLPIAVTVRWRGRFGPREFRMQTVLVDWGADA